MAVTTLAAGTGIAVASIPSSTGVFHGCYAKTAVRLMLGVPCRLD